MRRQGNRPTHILAAFAKNIIDSFVTWMEECPPFLASLVSQDAICTISLLNKMRVFLIKKKIIIINKQPLILAINVIFLHHQLTPELAGHNFCNKFFEK